MSSHTRARVVRGVIGVTGGAAGVALLLAFRTPQQPSGSALSLPGTTSSPSGSADAATAAPPATTASASPNPQYHDGSYTGQDAPNQYGDVQVEVVVSGGRISDVKVLQLPSDRARSEEISQIAGPMLHDEALQAQSAQIDIVSGATFTSESYAESLQSALDQAH